MSDDMEHVPPDGYLPYINDVLRQLFEGHGVPTSTYRDWVVFPDHEYAVSGRIVQEIANPNALILQLDVRLVLDDRLVLLESCSGWGESAEVAVQNALEAFANSTFHVLLAAFFKQPLCHGTERLECTIGGQSREVFLGVVTSRFGTPLDGEGEPDLTFFNYFLSQLESQKLSPGTHWLRLYQMQSQGAALANEVLLDNEPWSEMQTAMSRYPWPINDDPYDVRVFLVVKDLASSIA